LSRSVSKPQLSRAIAALEAAGKPVKGLLCQPDGSVAILTEAPALPVVSPENLDDLLELMGDHEASGAKRN
jgi:hypothetical protein